MATPADYDWDAHWSADSAGGPSRAQREVVSIVLAHAPQPTSRVVDLGSGAGLITCLVAGSLPEASVLGIDASGESVARADDRARARGVANASFAQARAEALALEDGSVDLVYSDQLLQYTDEAAVMGEVARVLRPGGRAVLFVPNAANLVFAATAAVAGDRHGSRRTYTRRRLRSLAGAAGLTVLDWDGYLPAYPVQRIGYFYAPRLSFLGTLAERVSDRLDSATDRALSRRFGFGLALVAERPLPAQSR